MAMYRNYVIMVTVCVFIVTILTGVMVSTGRPGNSKIDILEETETVDIMVTTEELGEPIPTMRDIERHPVNIPHNHVIYEPIEETTEVTEAIVETAPTETLVRETNPIPEPTEPVTEPPVVETEPVVEETEPPVVEEIVPTEPIPEPTEAPVVEEETTKDPYDPVELLACVIYQEAGSDWICDDCRYRVADVVLNRVADSRFPDTIHGVLTQSGQYGSYSSTGVVWPSRANNSGEKHAVQRAYNVAMSVLAGTHSELYGNGYVWQAQFAQGSDNVYCCRHYYGR